MPVAEVRLFCSVCHVNSITAPQGANIETKYTCPGCNAGKQPADREKVLAFDRWQFNGLSEDCYRAQLKPRPDAPVWTFDNAMLRRVANGHTQSREMTARRAACLYLYFRCSWEHREIGEALGMTEGSVKVLTLRLTKRAEKLLVK
jgi:hypothetical protein